jgi:protein SCO1/2
MRSLPLSLILFLWTLLFLTSCSEQQEKQTDLVTFPLRGKVVSIDTARRQVTISHEEIPNYMMSMTMPFKVKDPALLSELEPGDSVQGTLAVSRIESWLQTLSTIGKGEVPNALSVGDAVFKRLFKIGDTLPDEALINQDGRPIRLSHYRGKVLAVTFIYTRCPLPEFCIRMSDHFAKLQKSLTNDRTLNGKWHLITISFDPKFDTPKVLKDYGKTYGADFSTWDFLTDPDSSGQAIMLIADGLDLTVEDDEGGLIAHNLRTVLIDQQGKLANVIKGNEWTPEEVAAEMREMISQ